MMLKKIEFLLLVCISSCIITTVLSTGNKHEAVIDDNEFAEFEEFDDDDELVNKKKAETVEQTIKKSPSTPAADTSDEDDGQVEEEGVDEFDPFTDEEEFENYEQDSGSRKGSSVPGSAGGQKSSSPGLKITNVPLHLHTNWESYYLEILMVAGLIIYFTNFIFGRMKNQKLAAAWFTSHKPLLEANFSLVGDDGKSENLNPGLVKESENVYTLWCSGRTYCEGMLVQLKFLKRQDLINVMTQMFKPACDQINIKVNLSVDTMDTFVFALAAKKTATKISKEMVDLSTYCQDKKSVEKYGLSGNYVILSESGEVSSAILDSKVITLLSRHPNCIDYIHISDQYCGPKIQDEAQPSKLPETKKVMIFNFNLPGNGRIRVEDIESMKPLLQLVFYTIEKVKKFRLSREGKNKAEKNRLRVEEAFLKTTHSQRQEAAQLRREEKRRAEKERIMNEDDPDKQRKWEERDQRRELKKKTPKMKQLKVKAL